MSESLFQISTGLTRLMAQREDLLAEFAAAKRVDDQVRLGNAIEALELQIKEESEPNELAKVDSVRGYLLHCDMMEAAAKEEKDRQAANERHWKGTSDFLKSCVMQTLEATGKDKLQGKHGYLRSQVNSAAPAPIISRPDMVPRDLRTQTITVNARAWDEFTAVIVSEERCRLALSRLVASQSFQGTRAPSVSLIKVELEKPCAVCAGTKTDPADSLIRCPGCGGTGRNSVAGCVLPQKGRHVRVA